MHQPALSYHLSALTAHTSYLELRSLILRLAWHCLASLRGRKAPTPSFHLHRFFGRIHYSASGRVTHHSSLPFRHSLLLARYRFAMQRKQSGQLSAAARSSHRQSGEYRGRTSLGANGDIAVGITQHSAFPNGQNRSNGMTAGPQLFDLARSPPNTANKSNAFLARSQSYTDTLPPSQTPNTFLANFSSRVPVKLDQRVLSFTRPIPQSIQLLANISQRFVTPE